MKFAFKDGLLKIRLTKKKSFQIIIEKPTSIFCVIMQTVFKCNQLRLIQIAL